MTVLLNSAVVKTSTDVRIMCVRAALNVLWFDFCFPISGSELFDCAGHLIDIIIFIHTHNALWSGKSEANMHPALTVQRRCA